MRIAASLFVAVALVAAVTMMTRETDSWKSPSEETAGNTAASVRTARATAGMGSGIAAVQRFARDLAGPQLRGHSAGTAMPSMGVEP